MPFSDIKACPAELSLADISSGGHSLLPSDSPDVRNYGRYFPSGETLVKLLPFVLAAGCAVLAIILTMAVANSATTQQTVTSAAAGVGAIEGVRDPDHLGCIRAACTGGRN
jgi:hypothetical protein